MNDYPEFSPARSRGWRFGAPVRGAIRLGLCVVLFAGVAAACGSSKSTGQNAQPSSATSAQAPAVSFDPAAFASDGGAFGSGSSALSDAGYTDRYQDMAGLDHMAEAYAIIVSALPSAVDLNQVTTQAPGSISSDAYVNWQPMGRRDTALPPGNHGERIYELDVDLGPYLTGGDAVAYVWFLSRAEGNALDPNDLTATPKTYPTQSYSFGLDKATAGALINIFWVKGAAASPTAS